LGIGGRGIIDWEAVSEIFGDSFADGFAPGVIAEGSGVFKLGEAHGLEKGLRHVGDGASGARLDVAADDGGKQAPESGGEVVGSEIGAGKEEGQVLSEAFDGLRLGFLAGVIVAKAGRRVLGRGRASRERGTTLAAIGEGEAAERLTIGGAERRHGEAPF
jgi:hypothetical protein